MNAIKMVLLVFWLVGAFQFGFSQQCTEPKPDWIKMMNDPKVNYYKAVAAFNQYWEKRDKPKSEGEVFEKKDSKIRKYKTKETEKYAMEYKKFLLWQQQMRPFVKEDSNILSKSERLEIWEKEKNNR